jgi:Family of unknown function (DUF6455)
MLDPEAISFAPPPTGPGLAARITEHWRLWRQHRRWVGEIADAASLGRLDGILNDVSMTRAELDLLIAGPADAGRQLDQMAAAEGADLRRLRPEDLRQASWTCIHCEKRAPCKRWLRCGIWDGKGDPRCPNAALLRH